jgi:putative transposase
VRRKLVDPSDATLTVTRQLALLGLSYSSYRYASKSSRAALDEQPLRLLDEIYTDCPFYGSRKMQFELKAKGCRIGRRRVIRLMRKLGLYAIYPGPKTTVPCPEHKIYRYLLRGRKIDKIDDVWSSDITYIRLASGFIYLTAVIDWASRYVLSWSLSNTMDQAFCIDALRRSLDKGRPEIFNTDQGSQFTSVAYTSILLDASVQISMDGRGRALDNIFVERFWRSIKYELVYLNDFSSMAEASNAIGKYIDFYNNRRPHQALDYRTPAEVYFAGKTKPEQTGRVSDTLSATR